VDVWATGEASAALGFEAARVFDQLDPLEHRRAEVLEQRGLTGSAVLKSRRQISKDAIEFSGRYPPRTDGRCGHRIRFAR